ncbi:MAG: GNAT family N-acetyltransferase [Burkholderiales bacterium]|nr:GNAT family N-acetyltransferase [Burkholderiales bacterium]
MHYRFRRFDSFPDLPPAYAGLQAELARAGFFGDPAWFALLMRHLFDPADRLQLYAVEDAANGRPLLLAPLRSGRRDPAAPGARAIGSVSHPENLALAAVVFEPSLAQPEDAACALFSAFRRGDPALCDAPVDLIRLWPVEVDSDLADILLLALHDAGYRVQPYANSTNRFEATAGLRYEQYFAQRSANLRYSARRRRRALERTGTLALTVVRGGAELPAAIDDYLAVARASWKEHHTMVSGDMIAMIWLAAERGTLRLGLLHLGGVPAAVQFWIVSAGVAHCVRLAYAEAYKASAVGVVLTDFMIAQVLDGDQAERIDFGYGREDYKRGWMRAVRVYAGLMAFNPGTWRGRWHMLRHFGGQRLKRWLKAWLVRWRLRRADRTDPAAAPDAGGD